MAEIQLSRSELRRKYMQRIVQALVDQQGLSPAVARTTALTFLSYLQREVHAGKRVDLGFMAITPRKKAPVEIKFNLRGAKNATSYCIGEHSVWSVRMFESWLQRHRPAWSRF